MEINEKWLNEKRVLIANSLKEIDGDIVIYALREGAKPILTLWDAKGSGYLPQKFFPYDASGYLSYRLLTLGIVVCRDMIPIFIQYSDGRLEPVENHDSLPHIAPLKPLPREPKIKPCIRKWKRKRERRRLVGV